MRHLIALVGLALAVPHMAVAQSYDWRPVNHQTATMLRAGQYDAALPIVESALAECPNAATPVEAGLCSAIFSENLANVLEHRGDLGGAETNLRKTLAIRLSVLAANDPLIGQAHFFLALFYERQGRRVDEVASLLAAEAVARAGGLDRRSEFAGLLSRHAMALAALGKPADALKLYQEAHSIEETVGGPTSRNALVTLANLFTGQINAGFADAAIDAVSAVLASPDAGAFDPTQRALLAGKLALETSTTARSKAALAFAEAALPDLDNGLVTDPDASFTLLRGAARLNAALGDANRAVELARRSLDLAARTWGANSYPVTNALRSEADADAVRHDYPAAVLRLRQAAFLSDLLQLGFQRVQVEVELGRMQSRADHNGDAVADHLALIGSPILTGADPATRAAMLAMLGEDLVRLEAFEPGAKACGQATDLAARQPSIAKDYVVKALVCSGSAALALGRADEALEAANRAQTALWANVTAPAEPNRMTQVLIADLRARAFRDSGRNNQALPAYREELALAHKAGDPGSEGAVWVQIADVQRKMGLDKDADDSSVTGLALLGPDGAPRPRANLLNIRALVAVTLGRPADAVPLFQGSLALRRAEEVTEPLAIASGERDLAGTLSLLGRNGEAGRHMDVAIDGYRALGETRIPFLVVALNRRASIATAAGDPKRAKSALRELLPLQDPASDAANATRIALADLLDNQADRDGASRLRAEALAVATAQHGADSVAAVHIRLSVLASLRASGREAEAELAAWQCVDRAKGVHDVLLPCLMARAETASAAGSDRLAAEVGAQAVFEAETHWTKNGGTVLQALLLQARAEAALGDADAVIRLYDRIHGLAPGQGIARGWIDFGEGRLLTQAGEPVIGVAMLRLALDQAKRLHDGGLAVAATGGLAERLDGSGKGQEAVGLWAAMLPLLSDDAPAPRVTVLEGLGTAAVDMARYRDAVRLFGEAVSLSRRVMGAGSPVYGRLVVAWAGALSQSGEPDKAEDALRLLDGDSSPAMRRLRTIGMMRLASAANDPVAVVMLARSTMEQARATCGADSVGAAFARLDLIEALLGTGKHVDAAELEDALRVVQAQNPSWQVAYRAARLRGLLAARSGRLDDAAASYLRAELLATAYEGPESLAAAIEHSNRAAVRLRAGKADEADSLFRQALDMAAPGGHWRNTVWAQIAGDAAVAAERVGDIPRSIRLRRDADGLEPPVMTRATIRWL
jgi:tetratricopeptide (TPR) repeat protein